MAKAVLDHSETEKNPQTWLMLGWAFVFFFEVVSRPQREENRLLRLLQERDISCVRRLTPVSVRAATCKNRTTQSGLKHTKWDIDSNLFVLMSRHVLIKRVEFFIQNIMNIIKELSGWTGGNIKKKSQLKNAFIRLKKKTWLEVPHVHF